MAKIAIDCDGVLANFTRAFLQEANRIWPGKVNPEYQPVDWDDFDGLTQDEMKQVWARIKATPNWWLTLDAYSGNVGALEVFMYQHPGHDVWICTSRVPTVGMSVAKQTEMWLKACGVSEHHNYLGIIPVSNWHDKRSLYKAADIEWSVDDKAETIEHCQTLQGHTAVLLERAWNANARVTHRVMNLGRFFDMIEPPVLL